MLVFGNFIGVPTYIVGKITEIDKRNQSLFDFLNYTTFKMLKDESNAALWKEKLSNLNLKKAELIIKNNI